MRILTSAGLWCIFFLNSAADDGDDCPWCSDVSDVLLLQTEARAIPLDNSNASVLRNEWPWRTHKRGKGSTSDCEITAWTGRLGNNLATLANALLHAELVNCSGLVLPQGGSIRKLFSLPARISVVAQPTNSRLSDCRFPYNAGNFFWLNIPWKTWSCKASLSDLSRVLQLYVKPHLSVRAKATCAMASRQRDVGRLSVHLRGGDVFKEPSRFNWMEYRQAPCALYEAIINGTVRTTPSTRYDKVQVISEDLMNPCASWLVHGRPNLFEPRDSVASKSGGSVLDTGTSKLEQDACAIMEATSLVLSSSLFSKYIGLLNENTPTVFAPMPRPALLHKYTQLLNSEAELGCGALPPVQAPIWNIVIVWIPELEFARKDPAERRAWMENFSVGAGLASRQCRDGLAIERSS